MRRRTFAVPALVALASLLGLFSALLGEGPADWLAWAGLGVPVAAAAWARANTGNKGRAGARHHHKGKSFT